MTDPMDIYSKPNKTVEYKLGTLFYVEPRKNPNKPGRELVVNFDDRFPMIPDFVIHYSYFVRFLEKDNSAGNHYHHKKEELFIPIVGDFTIKLENVETKEKEELTVSDKDYCIFNVKPDTAHTVTAHEAGNVLLVLATSANIDSDEFAYEVK